MQACLFNVLHIDIFLEILIERKVWSSSLLGVKAPLEHAMV